MYRNLAAEMVRKGVRKKDIAELLGVRYATVIEKTNGKRRFYLDEAVKIKEAFFPDLSLEYLFDTDETKSA